MCIIILYKLTFPALSWDVKHMTLTPMFIDREPVGGEIFSEKRSNLLKIAAKTVSMGSAELFQRRLWFLYCRNPLAYFFLIRLHNYSKFLRSEFVGNILQRLGTDNITRKVCFVLCNSTLGATYCYICCYSYTIDYYY